MRDRLNQFSRARDILTYWLNAVRFEETMTARPKALRRIHGSETLDVLNPQGSHTYFKVPNDADARAFLLCQSESLSLPLADDRLSFCGHWLDRFYRRQRQRWTARDEDGLSTMICWPTVFFPHSDELASPLRFQASIEWYRADGRRFEPPDLRVRRSKTRPTPPTQMLISRVSDEDAVLLPYALDDRLFLNQLGVTDEELSDLYDHLRAQPEISPQEMIYWICSCLESDDGWTPVDGVEDSDDEGLFHRMCTAVDRRLRTSPRAPRLYSLGFVHEGRTIQTTHHLQRDIALTLQKLRAGDDLDDHEPLNYYLSGRPCQTGWTPLVGQYYPTPLTEDQRAIAERFLGSSLTGAQGPPGTGKTRLIIDLVAAILVERVRVLAVDGVMGEDCLLMASTNNRAVDNVFEPLQEQSFPLGLRAGSQKVTQSKTAAVFEHALRWLDGIEDDFDAEHELSDALEHFTSLHGELMRLEGTRHTHNAQRLRRDELESRCRELTLVLGDGECPKAVWYDTVESVANGLRRFAPRLDSFLRRITSHDWVEARRLYRRLDWTVVDDLKERYDALDIGTMEAVHVVWDTQNTHDEEELIDRVEGAIESIQQARDNLNHHLRQRRNWERFVDLRCELAELPALSDDGEMAPEPTLLARHHYRVFEAANRVRLAWIISHKRAIRDALIDGRDAALDRRSLRRLLDQDGGSGRWLRRLFPAIGSTLLSLGNVLATRPQTVRWLVIDEGGQCHPAHAVAGLLRAQSALVIGDVHQLEPVIQLGLDDERRVRKASRLNWSDDEIHDVQILANHGNSAQLLVERATRDKLSLRSHFRCQPSIIDICDRLCGYGLRVQTPRPKRSPAAEVLTDTVVILNTAGQQERLRGSWHNAHERKRVTDVLTKLSLAGVRWNDIAVITPYVGQLFRLMEDLRRFGIPFVGEEDSEVDFRADRGGVALGTVHRFQGGERSIVVFSTVVTQPASLGFINDRVNLINVAVSRARDHLVVVGHAPTLKQGRYSRLLIAQDDAQSLRDASIGTVIDQPFNPEGLEESPRK